MITFTRATYSDQVVTFVKTAIRRGELSQGDPVREVALAERLGISRAPIREALQILQQEGLISSVPQKGKTVRLVSATEIRQTFAICGILEAAAAASWLTRMDDTIIASLGEVMERIYIKARSATGLADMAELDEIFHETLLSGADNRQLACMAGTHAAPLLKFLLFRNWDTAYSPEEFCVRHKDVFDAVVSRNSAKVELSLRAHYEDLGNIMAKFCGVKG